MPAPVFNPFDTSTGQGIGGNIINPFQFGNKHYSPYPGTRPDIPAYTVAYDPKTMSLSDYLQGKYDHSGFDKFKEEAMRKGPSAWSQMAKLQQGQLSMDQRNKGAAESNSATAKEMDQLAAHGGLSSGARERAAKEGAKNYLSMAQDTDRQQGMNNMQIGMNDEQNRIQQLSQIPGMEQDQAKMWTSARDKDIQNTLQENERRNQYNQNYYNQQMDAYSADRTAWATEHSGKK